MPIQDFQLELSKILRELADDSSNVELAWTRICKKVEFERFGEHSNLLLLQFLRDHKSYPPDRRPSFDQIVENAMKFKTLLGDR